MSRNTATARAGSDRASLYDEITNKIISELETGRVPWGLARALAALTGETLTEAIQRALAERLERERVRRGHPGGLAGWIREIGEHCAALPDVSLPATDAAPGRGAAGMWR